MTEPWCVLLASRPLPRSPDYAQPAQKDLLSAAMSRASSIASRKTIAAVISAQTQYWHQSLLQHLDPGNLILQPRHQGTGYEVLLALLRLEKAVPASTPVLFFPVDYVVGDEDVMTRTLKTLVEWITCESRPVYLLGAVPRGPHEKLGYIIPWHDAIHMPTSVYEFVERPDVREARRLIHLGGLWNTFMFGGTLSALINLFRPEFDAIIAKLRAAMLTQPHDIESVTRAYDVLTPVDFSQNVLAKRTDRLHVLRLPGCGWWPLTSPEPVAPRHPYPAETDAGDARGP